MKVPSKVKFANEKVQKEFLELEYSNKLMHFTLLKAFDNIEQNAFCGVQIPKKLIPKIYLQKFKIHNLWKYDLPDGWRMLYAIESNEIIIISIVLEWMNHKEYEKRFKY